MPMSRHDAELFFDGEIPSTAVDTRAADRWPLSSPNARGPHTLRAALAAAARVTIKPDTVLMRMAEVIATYAERGCVTEGDLKRHGFTQREIGEHGPEAMRLVYIAFPTLPTLELAA